MGGANTVDGVAAAALMSSWTTCTPGYCLHYVWQAYKAQGAVSDGNYPTALSAWQASGQQVPGDRNPPLGFPVYLGARAGSSAGDVMISLGGGICVATDWTRNGMISTGVTIAQREAQTGRPYLGWARDILGNNIQGALPPASRKVPAMATLYARNDSDNPGAPATGWAWAGDGQGKAAWLEIGDPDLANRFAANSISGQAIFLSNSTWNAWQSAYLSAWQ